MTEQTQDHKRATKLAHVLPLDSLRRKVDPRHAALIIIDVQNDFCAPGGLVANEGQDVSEAVRVGERLPVLGDNSASVGRLVRELESLGHGLHIESAALFPWSPHRGRSSGVPGLRRPE
jgi:hypothetical protein